MIRITLTELMKHFKAYFDSVEKGLIIQVSRRGKVIAEIIPAQKKLILAGSS